MSDQTRIQTDPDGAVIVTWPAVHTTPAGNTYTVRDAAVLRQGAPMTKALEAILEAIRDGAR